MSCQFREPGSGEPCSSEATRVLTVYFPERQKQTVDLYCDEHAETMAAEYEGDPNRQLIANTEA